MSGAIRLGVSRCLLGERVRYDGGHKRDQALIDALGRFADLVPVCPEVECGLAVPREPMNLVGDPAAPRLVAAASGIDFTEMLTAWAARRLDGLQAENLAGFVFKSGSPSCGLEGAMVYRADGVIRETGMGIFARMFTERFAFAPCADELALRDPALRENFVERVTALTRKLPAKGI
jgi:uncharacterized protein YbbK (DUF523 family)